MSELSDIIKNWNTNILEDDDRVYDSKDDINRLIKVIPLLGEGVIQMKTSTRNLMINGLPLDGKLYKTAGYSATSGIVEVVPEGTDYVYHMAKSGTTQGAWYIKSTDTTSISQIPYVKDDTLFTNMLIKGSGTATLQFLDKDDNVLSEMVTPALTDTYQAFNVKGQLKDSVWSFRVVASDAIYFKQVMITRSSFPSDYMLSEEELEQLNIINTSDIDANTVTKSHAYQVIGLKNCPPNVSTSGLFINIQKDNFAQVFVPNDDTGIYYRVGVTTNRPNTKWVRLATSDNTYSKEDFTEMRTSDNINLIQDSSMSAGFWAFAKDNASTSVGSLNTAEGIAHITGNGTSGSSGAQYQVTNQNYQQPLLQNSEIQYEQDYTVSVETTWNDGTDIASNGEVPPSLIVRENYIDGSSKDIIRVKAIDKYGHNKWHKLSGTFKFSENRKNDISFIQVILLWKGAKGDVYFRRPKLEMASLPSAYTDDTVVSVEPNHNLLQDSRDLLDGWKMGGSKVSLDTTGDMTWYQGMRVQHQFGDWSYYGTTKTPVLENGKYYTVSAYMRGLKEGDISMYATILADKSSNHAIDFPLARHLTGEWRRYSYTFKFDASTQVANTSAIRVAGEGDWGAVNGSVYVAGIKLEEGKTATDWSPSIEETIVRYETQNWQKDKITADNGDLALRINSSGTDPMDKQFLSAIGTKTFYIQGGATGNNTGDSLRGILIKDSPTHGNAYGITNNNELWFLKIQDSKLTPWSKVSKEADVMQIKSTVDSINLNVSEVQSNLDNLAIGGRNYLADTDTPWQTRGSGGTNHSSSMKWLFAFGTIKQAPFNDGDYVTVSFDYTNVGTGAYGTIMTQFNDTPWAQFQGGEPMKDNGHFVRTIQWKSGWNDGEATGIQIRMDNVATTRTVTVYNMQFERGNKATDHKQAPEDTQALIEGLTVPNLIYNAGFKGTYNGGLDGWVRGENATPFYRTEYTPYKGSNSVGYNQTLTNTANTYAGLYSKAFTVTSNQTGNVSISFAGWVTSLPASSWARVELYFYDAKGAVVGSSANTPSLDPSKTNQWQEIYLDGVSVPAAAATAKLKWTICRGIGTNLQVQVYFSQPSVVANGRHVPFTDNQGSGADVAQLRTDVDNINSYQKIDIGSLQNTNGNIFLETQHGIAHLHIQALFSTTNNTKGAFTAFTIPKAFAPKYAFSSTLGFNIDIQHQDLVYSVYEDGRFSVVNNNDDAHQVIGTITWFY